MPAKANNYYWSVLFDQVQNIGACSITEGFAARSTNLPAAISFENQQMPVPKSLAMAPCCLRAISTSTAKAAAAKPPATVFATMDCPKARTHRSSSAGS